MAPRPLVGPAARESSGLCRPAAVEVAVRILDLRERRTVLGVATTPREALARLLEATGDGRLDDLCERRGVALLSAFGSAAVAADDSDVVDEPDDLDIGVAFGSEPDLLGLLDEFVVLTGFDGIDLVPLDDAGPVLRSEALTGLPLFESVAGAFAQAQMAALAERWDTAWLRRLDLEAMAD